EGDQTTHQRRWHGLPPHGFTLLVQAREALFRVEIVGRECQSTSSATRCLGVKSQQRRVQFGVVAGGTCYLVDLGQPCVGQRSAGAGKPSRHPGGQAWCIALGCQCVGANASEICSQKRLIAEYPSTLASPNILDIDPE